MPAEFPTGLNYQGAITRTGGTFFFLNTLSTSKSISGAASKPIRLLWVYIVNASNTGALTPTDNWYGIYDSMGGLSTSQLRLPVLIKAGTSQLISVEIPFTTGGFIVASTGTGLPWTNPPVQSAQNDSLIYGAYQLQA